jgi:hypothetical protein
MYDQQAAGFASPPTATAPAPVLISVAGRQPQSRGTVLIRVILAIPHLVVLAVLSFAAAVVAFIGWWGALFTGQLPDFAASFLLGVLQWQARVYGYLYLLTDVYPPFALGDADYPIRLAAMPGRLNRLAVLFRFFLTIPAWIVQSVLAYGTLVISFFIWLIALVTGSVPEAAHQALAASLRFQMRVYGFEFMLTSAYPWSLLGDRAVEGGFAGTQPAFGGSAGTEPAFAAPDSADPDSSESESESESAFAEPAFAEPAFAGLAGPAFASTETVPAAWRVVLSSAARWLLALFLVVGAAGLIVQNVLEIHGAASAVSKAQALSQSETAFNPLNNAVGTANSSMQSCGQSVSCVTKVDASLVSSFNTFATGIAAIAMPAGAPSTDAQTVVTDAHTLASDFSQLSKATTASQYSSLEQSTGIQAALDKLGQDYDKLGSSLGASTSGS